MRLYKPKYKDKKSGKTKKLDVYWIGFRCPAGTVRRWSLGVNGEDVAKKMMVFLRGLNDHAKSKTEPPVEYVNWVRQQVPKLRNKIYEAGLLRAEQANCTKSLLEHLQDFITDLRINSSDAYPAQTESNIKRIMAGCGLEFFSDVNGIKIRKFLIEAGLSNHTAQHYICSFKAFCRWLKKHNRIKEVPAIDNIKYITPDQRALEQDELHLLYETAKNSTQTLYKMDGKTRYCLYKLAFESGLRKSELSALTRNSFDFQKHTVQVPGTETKNDKPAYQRLTEVTSNLLREYTQNMMPDTKVFNINDRCFLMIRKDCKAAGIETTNWKGTIKFHSLRHSLASHLAGMNVPPHVVQKIMRHSNIETTMKYYTHLLRGAEDKAIAMLEGFGDAKKKEKTA